MKAADAGSGMRRGFHKSVRASQKMLRAATRGDIRTLEDQLLVEFHVDAVDSGGNGHSSLHAASEAGQDECVRWLIQKGCDVNIASTKHGHTPLHIAGSPVVARVLLEAGASAVAKDKMRQTPLQRFRSIRMSGDEKSRVLATQILEVLVSWGTDDGTQKVDRIRRTTLVRTNSGAGLNLPAIDGNRANMPSSVSLLAEPLESPLHRSCKLSPSPRPFAPTVQHLQGAARALGESAEALESTLQKVRSERRKVTAKQESEAAAEREKLLEKQRQRDERLSGRLPSLRPKEEHEAWEIDIPESEVVFDDCDDLIGAGGQGQVFKATWHRTRVAVKRVAIEAEDEDDKDSEALVTGSTKRDNAAVDKKNIDDLKKESRILSSLKHPNILQFLGCHFQYPLYYMVMELVEGPNGKNNLRQVIDDKSIRPNFSISLRARMLQDISQGCAYLHERDAIHRDLKCSNVLVDQSFRCKIADFGLSRVIDQKVAKVLNKMGPMEKSMVSAADGRERTANHNRPKLQRQLTRKYNTSAIISPEVMEGGKYDSKVDCFSFGIIIVEMLTFLEPELIPRAKFGLTKTNTQAHMGIGAVHDTKLRELLSEKVSEDQPPEAHALVALAKRCLKAFPTERPTMGEACDAITALRQALPEITKLPTTLK